MFLHRSTAVLDRNRRENGIFSPFSLVFVDLNIPKGGGMKGSGAYHSLDRERVAPNGENPES
jgi:hypothetical protein